MDHSSVEPIQPPTSRTTYWNCHDPSLGPFDDTLVPTMASIDEACSSAFQHLFANSTTCGESSACDESEPIFSAAPPTLEQSPNMIFGGAPKEEADQSSLQATAQSYYNSCAYDESSMFAWSLPSSPLGYDHPQEAGELDAGEYGDGELDLAIFEPLSSDQVPFLREPQPDNWGAGKERVSWHSPTMSGGRNESVFHPVDPPLESPCSAISGSTKASQEGDSRDTMAPLSRESFQAALAAVAADQSISETRQVRQGRGALKRKWSKARRGRDEVESQRITHIAVERNRRKQMNEHLADLRALMPGSYVQKSDQASIVGGAIEFVKELEHLLLCLQSQKRRRAYCDLASPRTPTSRLAIHVQDPHPISQITGIPAPIGNFPFHSNQIDGTLQVGRMPYPQLAAGTILAEQGEAKSEVASVEVRMEGPERTALVKVMALRRSGQLLRTVVALESLGLTVMHANITTVSHTALYAFTAHHAGPPAACARVMSAQEIAAALHQTFTSLHSLQF